MSKSAKFFTVALTACSINLTVNGTVFADNATNSETYAQKDFPKYYDVPASVPSNLTALEYYKLLETYAYCELPAQAYACIANLRKMKLDDQMQRKLKILQDTSLPKKVPPREAVLLNLKGKHSYEQRARAIAICIECINKYPEYENTYMTLANLYALDDKHQLSAETYRKALKINPHNTKALVAMGDQLISAHHFKEAKEAYTAAYSLNPEDIMAKERFESISRREQAFNPLQQAGNVIMGTIGLVFLPGALMARDAEALKTSGFIDKSGKFLYHRLNTSTSRRKYSCGLWFVYDQFVDKKGNTIGNPKDHIRSAEDFSEGLAAVKILNWGFLDTKGNLAIKPIYDDARSFSEGLAPVKLGARWGYVDKTGKLILPLKYTGALSFSDGLAAVVVNNKVGYIDRTGKMVIQPKYDVGMSFSDGLAIVTTYETEIKRHHSLVLDKTGKVRFDLTQVMQNLENTKEFLSSGEVYKWGRPDVLVAADTNKAIERYTNSPDPSEERYFEGLKLVRVHDKYGYLDQQGKLVIPCKFGSADPFHEGLAAVSLDPPSEPQNGIMRHQIHGYIDKTGKFVIKPQYTWTSAFHEGLAYVRRSNGSGGFINHAGQMVIPVTGWASDFNDGVAGVGENLVYP